MNVHEGVAYLLPSEEQASGYPNPTPVADMDPEAIKERIKEWEIDFFDTDKSPTGNSIARYHALEAQKQIANGIIAQIHYFNRFGCGPEETTD